MSHEIKVRRSVSRSTWSAIGAAVAVCLGVGGIGVVNATTSGGERAIFKPITPCRLADTRPAPNTVGDRTSPIGPGETYTLNAWGPIGDCTATDLPNGITALSLNVTAVNPTDRTFVTLFPGGEPLPRASHLNPGPSVAVPLPNAVTADLNAAGDFSVYNFVGSVHIIIDVVGVYDDHDHDDRYYSRSDVDAALTTKSDAADVEAANLWAVVESGGTLARGSNAVSTALVTNTGYEVIFNRDVTQCAYVASPGPSVPGNPAVVIATVSPRFGTPEGVFVEIRNLAGARELQPFHLTVQC